MQQATKTSKNRNKVIDVSYRAGGCSRFMDRVCPLHRYSTPSAERWKAKKCNLSPVRQSGENMLVIRVEAGIYMHCDTAKGFSSTKRSGLVPRSPLQKPPSRGLEGSGGEGGCFLFLLFWGTPKDMDLRNAYVEFTTSLYCIAEPHKRVSMTTFGSRLSTCY